MPVGESQSTCYDPDRWWAGKVREGDYSGEKAITIPDMMALTRVLMVPAIIALIRAHDRLDHAYGWAFALFLVAAFTDFLDGYLARRMKSESVLGSFLDTTADKLLVTATLLALVSVSRVSVWAALAIMMREFVVMALRGLVAVSGGLIKPSMWGKIKTTAQFAAIALAFMRLPEPWGILYLDQWVMWVAVILTIGSGWNYLVAYWATVSWNRSSP